MLDMVCCWNGVVCRFGAAWYLELFSLWRWSFAFLDIGEPTPSCLPLMGIWLKLSRSVASLGDIRKAKKWGYSTRPATLFTTTWTENSLIMSANQPTKQFNTPARLCEYCAYSGHGDRAVQQAHFLLLHQLGGSVDGRGSASAVWLRCSCWHHWRKCWCLTWKLLKHFGVSLLPRGGVETTWNRIWRPMACWRMRMLGCLWSMMDIGGMGKGKVWKWISRRMKPCYCLRRKDRAWFASATPSACHCKTTSFGSKWKNAFRW